MRTVVVPVAGTWTRRRERYERLNGVEPDPPVWYRAGSPLMNLIAQRYSLPRFDQNPGADIGYWSGDLQGTLLQGMLAGLSGTSQITWHHGGGVLAVSIDMKAHTFDHAVILAHSWGTQIACHAVKRMRPDLRNRVSLLSVDGPNGKRYTDLFDTAAACLDGRWVHMHSGAGWGSRMRWLGARCLPWQRQQQDFAAANIRIPDHSSVLTDPYTYLDLWDAAFETMETCVGGF